MELQSTVQYRLWKGVKHRKIASAGGYIFLDRLLDCGAMKILVEYYDILLF